MGSKNMKKKYEKIIVLLLCMAMMLQLMACGANGKCEAVVEKFETSCNEGDIDGILDCITPSIASPIKMAIGVTNLISDVDVTSMLTEVLAELMGNNSADIDVAALLGTMKLDVTKIKKDSKDRLVYVDIDYEVLGAPLKVHGVFRMEEKDKEWYIKSFKLVDED